jgi:hypothetical protein
MALGVGAPLCLPRPPSISFNGRAHRNAPVSLGVPRIALVARDFAPASRANPGAVTSRRSRRGIGVPGGREAGCEGLRNGRE